MKQMGMREFLNKLKQIKEVMLKLNRKELISLVNSVNKHYEEYGVTGLSIILDDLIYQPFGEKFFENNFGSKTSAAIAVYKSLVTAKSHFDWTDDYIRLNSLEGVESISEKDLGEKIKDRAEDVAEVILAVGLPQDVDFKGKEEIEKIINEQLKEGLEMGYKELSKEQWNKIDEWLEMSDFEFAEDYDGNPFFLFYDWSQLEGVADDLRADEDKDLSDEEVIEQYGEYGFMDEYFVETDTMKICPYYKNGLQAYATINGEIYSDNIIHSDEDIKDMYIETLVNEPKKANTILDEKELVDSGFVKYNEEAYENGWYGQVDDPKEILKKILEENPDAKVIFSINYAAPFATGFDVFVKKGSLKESKETTKIPTIEAKWDPIKKCLILPKEELEDWEW